MSDNFIHGHPGIQNYSTANAPTTTKKPTPGNTEQQSSPPGSAARGKPSHVLGAKRKAEEDTPAGSSSKIPRLGSDSAVRTGVQQSHFEQNASKTRSGTRYSFDKKFEKKSSAKARPLAKRDAPGQVATHIAEAVPYVFPPSGATASDPGKEVKVEINPRAVDECQRLCPIDKWDNLVDTVQARQNTQLEMEFLRGSAQKIPKHLSYVVLSHFGNPVDVHVYIREDGTVGLLPLELNTAGWGGSFGQSHNRLMQYGEQAKELGKEVCKQHVSPLVVVMNSGSMAKPSTAVVEKVYITGRILDGMTEERGAENTEVIAFDPQKFAQDDSSKFHAQRATVMLAYFRDLNDYEGFKIDNGVPTLDGRKIDAFINEGGVQVLEQAHGLIDPFETNIGTMKEPGTNKQLAYDLHNLTINKHPELRKNASIIAEPIVALPCKNREEMLDAVWSRIFEHPLILKAFNTRWGDGMEVIHLWKLRVEASVNMAKEACKNSPTEENEKIFAKMFAVEAALGKLGSDAQMTSMLTRRMLEILDERAYMKLPAGATTEAIEEVIADRTVKMVAGMYGEDFQDVLSNSMKKVVEEKVDKSIEDVNKKYNTGKTIAGFPYTVTDFKKGRKLHVPKGKEFDVYRDRQGWGGELRIPTTVLSGEFLGLEPDAYYLASAPTTIKLQMPGSMVANVTSQKEKTGLPASHFLLPGNDEAVLQLLGLNKEDAAASSLYCSMVTMEALQWVHDDRQKSLTDRRG